MRILTDRNVHSRISDSLSRAGHNVLRLKNSRLPNDAKDPELILFARTNDRVIITADMSFTKVVPSDLKKKGITEFSNEVKIDTATTKGKLKTFSFQGEKFIHGNRNQGHNGVVIYENKYLRNYSPQLVASLIITYLDWNKETYIKSRVNNVCPP